MPTRELDVDAGAFNAVISRLGLIYFPDRAAALAGQYRAAPGGRVATVVYSNADRKPFAVPVWILRRRAQLPAPAPGQPGAPGVLEDALRPAGLRDVGAQTVIAPLRMPSSSDCVRFERESFSALHQMLAGLSPDGREQAWRGDRGRAGALRHRRRLRGPCELMLGWGTK